jgi:hypothetical protein
VNWRLRYIDAPLARYQPDKRVQAKGRGTNDKLSLRSNLVQPTDKRIAQGNREPGYQFGRRRVQHRAIRLGRLSLQEGLVVVLRDRNEKSMSDMGSGTSDSPCPRYVRSSLERVENSDIQESGARKEFPAMTATGSTSNNPSPARSHAQCQYLPCGHCAVWLIVKHVELYKVQTICDCC